MNRPSLYFFVGALFMLAGGISYASGNFKGLALIGVAGVFIVIGGMKKKAAGGNDDARR